MVWPVLIAVGAAVMAGSVAGREATEEDPSILTKPYPAPSTEEKLAADQLLTLATKLYEESQGQNPAFYKAVFEGLPEGKMDDSARSRLKTKYEEISRVANQTAMQEAGKAFGENMDSMVERGAITPVMADKMKIQNEAQVRAMMSVLDKKWQASQIADSRKMWLGDQQSRARGVGILAEAKHRNESLMNQAIDTGLRSALKRAGSEQAWEGAQMTANEKVLQETRAAEYDFWGKMVFPGSAGGRRDPGYDWNRNKLPSSYTGTSYREGETNYGSGFMGYIE